MLFKIEIEGTRPILFNRFVGLRPPEDKRRLNPPRDDGDPAEKVYWTENGEIGLPTVNMLRCLVSAGAYFKDPRSSRASASKFLSAALIIEPVSPKTQFLSFGTKKWDGVDQRRVCVNRASVIRSRPYLDAGWKLEFNARIILPEYFGEQQFLALLTLAGSTVGLGDYRPQYGQFKLSRMKRG